MSVERSWTQEAITRDPSIQVSLTRTGKRAYIDVDYRSSRGPKALVNGHLTSVNSNVRAGSNCFGRVRRWNAWLNGG